MDALPRREKILRALPFFVLWLAGLALFGYHNSIAGPTDAPVEIPAAGAVLSGLPWLTVVIVVLYFILRPNSFNWSWRRALAALGIMLPWSFLNSGPLWRPGWWAGWHYAHGQWLLGVTALLVVLFVISLLGASLAAKEA